MTTSLTLKTGPLTAVVTTEDDVSAQAILIMYAHAIGVFPGESSQVKLDAVAMQLAEHLRVVALERWKWENGAAFEASANAAVHW